MKKQCKTASSHLLPAPYLQVDLYENGTIAIVEAVSPELGNRVQRVRVQLPGTSQELLQKFRERKVDFAAHSNTEDGGAVFLNLLGKPVIPAHCWLGLLAMPSTLTHPKAQLGNFQMHQPACPGCMAGLPA